MTETPPAHTAWSGPAWLQRRRQAAQQRLGQVPAPRRGDERWRYTDLSLLQLDSFSPPALGASEQRGAVPEAARGWIDQLASMGPSRALQIGGSASVALDAVAARAGVVLCELDQAARTHGKQLRQRLGALVPEDHFFGAHSMALHQGGLFLHVPAGVRLEQPVAVLVWLDEPGSANFWRNVVLVDRDARLDLTVIYASAGAVAGQPPSLAVPVTELFVGQGARARWIDWQQWGAGVRHVGHMAAHLGPRARLTSAVVSLGGDLSRVETEVQLAGQGARAELLGATFPRGEQQMEHWTVQDHAAPDTWSELAYRGALDDAARSVYYGTIRVRPGARGTDAYQANRSLLLASGARADSNPQLEIENNDVRCTHGATVGPLDQEQLFYLMSRGIPLQEARRLVVQGFFDDVRERVAWSGLADRLASEIAARAGAPTLRGRS